MALAEELERLAQLHRDGDLTDDEYAAAKRQLLASEAATPQRKETDRAAAPAPAPAPQEAPAAPQQPVPASPSPPPAPPSLQQPPPAPARSHLPGPGDSRGEDRRQLALLPYRPESVDALAKWIVWGLWAFVGLTLVVGALLAYAAVKNAHWETLGTETALDASMAADDWYFNGYLASVVLFLIIGAAIIAWMWRIHAQLQATSNEPMRYSRGWVIFGWVIPVAFLFIPYRIVKDFVAKARAEDARPLLWWLAFVASVIAAAASSELWELENYNAAYATSAIEHVADIVAATALIQIVRSVTARQVSPDAAASGARHMPLSEMPPPARTY